MPAARYRDAVRVGEFEAIPVMDCPIHAVLGVDVAVARADPEVASFALVDVLHVSAPDVRGGASVVACRGLTGRDEGIVAGETSHAASAASP